jgi:glycosyltransferase involved in cell wall biosynthesis
MQTPTVSFVVPCYNLAHFLPECVNSILSQTYANLEVLIMDDCSPDNTPQIAASFQDERVRYIRNDPNLGHLRNYNKGIALSRGKYVWLISADDYLRKPYITEKYVNLLDTHPNVGYVICPGLGVLDGVETRVLGAYRSGGHRDRIMRGHDFLKKLLHSNAVLTPSAMVRRECYEKISFFPENMPWAGDWFLWCLFALYYDVGYFADHMLCYREHHDLSMTHILSRERLEACAAEEISIPWFIRKRALEIGFKDIAKECLAGVAKTYGRILASERYIKSACFMNFGQVEDSIRKHVSSESEINWIRARIYASVANQQYWRGELNSAKKYYGEALKRDPRMPSVYVKRLLLTLGKRGDHLRRTILSSRGGDVPQTNAKSAELAAKSAPSSCMRRSVV